MDLRAAPVDHDSLDHTGHLMTKGGPYAWVTAVHPKRGLVLGYLFKTSEYPWLQTWENYPAQGMMARGLEFGTQAFDFAAPPSDHRESPVRRAALPLAAQRCRRSRRHT
ncbi:MAG: hypothetical protein R2724_15330 [Bryobacterales bacterium]